jgi:hypothetical protein
MVGPCVRACGICAQVRLNRLSGRSRSLWRWGARAGRRPGHAALHGPANLRCDRGRSTPPQHPPHCLHRQRPIPT